MQRFMQNSQFVSKIKNAKKQDIAVFLCKKHLKNERILKIANNGQQAKAISYAKWSFWLQS